MITLRFDARTEIVDAPSMNHGRWIAYRAATFRVSQNPQSEPVSALVAHIPALIVQGCA